MTDIVKDRQERELKAAQLTAAIGRLKADIRRFEPLEKTDSRAALLVRCLREELHYKRSLEIDLAAGEDVTDVQVRSEVNGASILDLNVMRAHLQAQIKN